MNRRRVVIAVAIVVLIIILIVLAIVKAVSVKNDQKEAYLKSAVQLTVDKDTGDQITVDPNLGNQTVETQPVTVLGLEAIINAGALDEQINFVKDQLNTFSAARLNNKYATITVRPQGLTTADGVTSTTIRLGQSDDILPITITAKNTGETQVVITDPSNKFGGTFDSGLTIMGAD
ncbi:MAG: hypothetical protein JWO99_868 [Candidatus Saccharibacteria bacterium]|nr:hypothetical protein [Candidatus Saccharibacteria bacterium]